MGAAAEGTGLQKSIPLTFFFLAKKGYRPYLGPHLHLLLTLQPLHPPCLAIEGHSLPLSNLKGGEENKSQ